MSYEAVDSLSHVLCDRVPHSVTSKLKRFVTMLFNNIEVKVSV